MAVRHNESYGRYASLSAEPKYAGLCGTSEAVAMRNSWFTEVQSVGISSNGEAGIPLAELRKHGA